MFVRVRRSSDLVNATTRLKLFCPTAEQCDQEKKSQFCPKIEGFLTHFKHIRVVRMKEEDEEGGIP